MIEKKKSELKNRKNNRKYVKGNKNKPKKGLNKKQPETLNSHYKEESPMRLEKMN